MATWHPIPTELTLGPFRSRDAAAVGVSRAVLRGTRFRHVFRDVYVLASIPDTPAIRFDAVRLLLPNAVASHHTAAEMCRLPVPASRDLHVTLAAPATQPRIAGICAHVATLEASDLEQVNGRLTTAPARTFLDLAALLAPLSLVDLVVLGDAAVRQGWCGVDDIRSRAVQATGRGCSRARQAAGLVRAKVDSPMETRLRLLLVLAGLPEPSINQPIIAGPGPVATPDLSYPAARIAIEYDGGHHRESAAQWSRDKLRGRLVRDLAWDLLEVTARDVYREPYGVITWVHERLLAAGVRGTPDRPSDQWRAHWQAMTQSRA